MKWRKRERQREKERERERVRAISHSFILSNYYNFSNNLNFFTWFKCPQTFHTFQQTSTLFTFAFLRLPLLLPLFSFVYLCSNDVSMHKFLLVLVKTYGPKMLCSKLPLLLLLYFLTLKTKFCMTLVMRVVLLIEPILLADSWSWPCGQ